MRFAQDEQDQRNVMVEDMLRGWVCSTGDLRVNRMVKQDDVADFLHGLWDYCEERGFAFGTALDEATKRRSE